MKLDITELNFNNSKELWRKCGINTFDVPLNSTAFTINGNDAVCTLSLPHEDLLYSDYAAIMYWIHGDDGTTRPESRAGFCVPSSYEMNIDLEDDTSVSPLVTSTVSGDTKGLAELTIHCENSAALAAIVANPKAITFLRPMWYTGYASENELNPDVLTPENTLVVEEMADILSMSDPTENDLMFLNGKKYLFTFDDEPFEWEYEEDVILSPSFFEIKQRTGTEDFSNGAVIPGSSIYRCGKSVFSQNSYFYAVMKRMNFSFGDSIGYAPDEIEDVLNGNVFEYFDDTEIINSIINYFDTDEMMNIHLRDNGMYLISNSLCFNKSNICLIGHGSEIRIMTESFPNGLNLFGNSTVANVRNIELCDLKMKGRAKYENGAVLFPDQGMHFYTSISNRIFPCNLTVYKVMMDGFGYGVHANLGDHFYDYSLKWNFIDCVLSRTEFGYHFSNTKLITISGGSVDCSLSSDKRQHCVYICTRCSYITVEKCTLKNCAGGAIHQYGFFGKANSSDHNRFRNLLIRNCYMGLTIGGYTHDIIAENITGEKICGFLQFNNCSDVVVRNYYATGNNEASMKLGTGSEYHIYTPDSDSKHWEFFKVEGPVKARVEDCSFSDQPDFKMDDFEYYYFETSQTIKNALNEQYYDDSWIKDGCAAVDLRFYDCKFSFKNLSTVNIGSHSISYCVQNIVFNKCTFAAHKIDQCNGNSIFYLKGNTGGEDGLINHPLRKSSFSFIDCTGILNVVNEDSMVLYKGYFARTNNNVDFDYGNMNIITSFDPPSNIPPLN